MVAAVTATSADLVFTGELNGDFIVLDGRDGSVLYRSNTGGAISGGIVTYQVGGKQYVAVLQELPRDSGGCRLPPRPWWSSRCPRLRTSLDFQDDRRGNPPLVQRM